MAAIEQEYLRFAFEQAQNAREHGNHPFGAVLVDANGNHILSAENSVVSDSDVSAHAELNLIRLATKKFSADELSACTLYSSAEPCPMCAGAIVWSNIRHVVFGLGMHSLYRIIGDAPDTPSLKLESRFVFEHAPWPIEVIGPVMENEAIISHQNFW